MSETKRTESNDGGTYDNSIPHNESPTQSKSAGAKPPTGLDQSLAARGLSAATVKHFQLKPHKLKQGDGWKYPVRPGVKQKRFKARDSKPKYKWLPGKPQGMTFYDVDGNLEQYVREAGGVLYLATGEADVWALFEAGIRNATCLLLGEGNDVPEWFLPELQRLGVAEVRTAPDCDEAGTIFARNVAKSLNGTDVYLVQLVLPFSEGSKADIGQLLLSVGAQKLRETLEELPELQLPQEPGVPNQTVSSPSPGVNSDLYERWCVEVVESAAHQVWSLSGPNGKEFSKPIRCPFHDDNNPSAGWNYRTHSVNCFACGQHDTKEVAAKLGVQTWEDYKAEQALKSRSTRQGPSQLESTGTKYSNSGPYRIDVNGRMVHEKVNRRTGDVTLTPIADFVAVITTDIISEDGSRDYTIKGETVFRTPFSTTIPASDMEDGRTLKSKLSAVSDPRAAIYPNMSHHLAPAIRSLSSDIKVVRNYNRTGWVNRQTFVIPGREPEDVRIHLPRKLRYAIDPHADLDEGLVALEHLIRSVGPENSLPVLTFLLQAPMGYLAHWQYNRYALFIQGRTGMFKTSWTQAALAIYGPEFAFNDALLLKWGEGATPLSIMAYAAQAHDMPLLIDNYKPNTGGGEAAFITVIHNIVEGTDKDRLDRDANLKESKPVYAWPIITGEDVPDSDASTLARLFLVRYEEQPENAGALLSVAQSKSAHLNAIGRVWLDFLESKRGQETIQNMLGELDGLRDKTTAHLLDTHKEAANAPRIATNLATNHITWMVLCNHPILGPLFSRYEASYQAGLEQAVQTMSGATTISQAAMRFRSALQELLDSGRCILVGLDRDVSEADRDRVLGYQAPDGSVYLYSEIARQAVHRLMGPDALGGVSAPALHQQLKSLGYLVERSEASYLVSKRVGQTGQKKPTWLLHVTREFLFED